MGSDAADFASPATPLAAARAPGSGAGVYQVGGVPVEFPYKPYGTQLAFMGRVIATLDRARRQGRSHALLESPTGTGKSLSLLCSALAWQRHYPLRAPPADPLLHGGGFVPEDTQKQAPPPGIPEKAPKRKNVPTIYYATRTHAQITQVIREYHKTSYRVRMTILASRKHYCVNKNVCMSANIDEQCKSLLDHNVQGCPEFKNAQKLSRHPSIQIGGCYEVHDIEDLVRVGQKVKGCPYFAAQTMAEAAQLVFCPYNYLISPVVRRAMDIDISGSIIVLDEAHNIEDMARDAGSFDADEESILFLQAELESLVTDGSVSMIYQPLYGVVQGLNDWITKWRNDHELEVNKFENPASFWTGEEAMKELQYAGITPAYFTTLQECATKAVKAASDTESEGVHLSGGSAMTLESLFSSLSYFFAQNGRHSNDYQLALQRSAKREGNSVIGWKCVMSLWCLNPAVVFRDIAELTLSVILTSGLGFEDMIMTTAIAPSAELMQALTYLKQAVASILAQLGLAPMASMLSSFPYAVFDSERATRAVDRAPLTVEAQSQVESLYTVTPVTHDEESYNRALDSAICSFSYSMDDEEVVDPTADAFP
ncbi:hypothetical protein GUJ93_ZPchr0009g839 [Zizania palustris]|uniref:Helicase ATP-binding domain-containing protein n=1 Tax=Zizania palustris TaxID=103762 RepID=A0A8J5RPM9_ZIZPA|nr:hypothetical protein GUJ93_ZPchr0009g839 [Zizania palustris]